MIENAYDRGRLVWPSPSTVPPTMGGLRLLLVGGGFQSVIDALRGTEFDVAMAPDASAAIDVLGGIGADVLMVNAKDFASKHRLLRTMTAELADDAIPILVLLDAEDQASRQQLICDGASDCIRTSDVAVELQCRLQLLCKVRSLAATVIHQRTSGCQFSKV